MKVYYKFMMNFKCQCQTVYVCANSPSKVIDFLKNRYPQAESFDYLGHQIDAYYRTDFDI